MRQVQLSTVKAGITRLREKGGASPEALFDLLNGYVTAARTIKSRPGSRIQHRLPAGTKGMMIYRGKFVVFSHVVTASVDPEVTVVVLRHPTVAGAAIQDIHFATPFLGFPYVVAQFDSGEIFHYWLEEGEVWQPGKVYLPGALVMPSTGNGLAYRLEGDTSGYTPWAPNVARAVGDVVVPTTDNGFKYTVIETTSDSARSGTTEPTWPTTDGETVYEDADQQDSTPTASGGGSSPTVPPSVSDRYGSGPKGGNNAASQEI